MTSLARHLYASAHNNAWANHRLLQACGRLTQDEFTAPRTGFFPSIRATLNRNQVSLSNGVWVGAVQINGLSRSRLLGPWTATLCS
jgi:uncharacterized damage-inducible protein DinB